MTAPVEIRKTNLENCREAEGIVVVVDVLRAFTTTAHAFARGAREIILVSTVEQAFALREQDSDYLLAGEVNGLPIDGFDLPNSPSTIEGLDLDGRRLVLRTTAGTQGVVLAQQASRIFVASLCVAGATARNLEALDPEIVTFVETGVRRKGGGEEDIACADYIASLITGRKIDIEDIERRVIESRAASKFSDASHSDFPRDDLDRALQIDRFAFAMQVNRVDDRLVLTSTVAG